MLAAGRITDPDASVRRFGRHVSCAEPPADTLSADAGPRRHQLRARRRRPAARALGARPGRARSARRGVEVEVFGFPPGSRQYIPATRRLRRLLRRERFDLVHAHYGLPGWCALLAGASPLVVSFHGTDVRHRGRRRRSRGGSPGGSTSSPPSRGRSFEPENGRPGLPPVPGSAVLPCGPDLAPLRPAPAGRGPRPSSASTRTGATCSSRPTRPAPRSAPTAPRELAAACGAELLTGGSIEPDADAALDQRRQRRPRHLRLRGLRDGLRRGARLRGPGPLDPGRDRPLRPRGIAGALCAPFDLAAWSAAAPSHLDAADPRVAGAARAAALSAARMAERTIEAYRDVLAAS